MAASSVPLQLAETIQTAHINWDPSARHDVNPSTAADTTEPVVLDEKSTGEKPGAAPLHDHHDLDSIDGVDDDLDEDVVNVRPKRRFSQLPPLPDLRFEQSYLHSIANADTWWKVAGITVRDQLVMPLVQGVLYNLAICGWQFWNKNAQIHGNTVGARARRWWFGVNNWAIPSEKTRRFR